MLPSKSIKRQAMKVRTWLVKRKDLKTFPARSQPLQMFHHVRKNQWSLAAVDLKRSLKKNAPMIMKKRQTTNLELNILLPLHSRNFDNTSS